MSVKYYKVLLLSGKSPTKEFDYSPYLPKDGNAGNWLPKIENAYPTKEGYYVSQYWNFWYEDGARIFEVEVGENIPVIDEHGVSKQLCCATLRLLKDVTDELLENPPSDERFNMGESNSGLRNIGSFNTGEFNIGKRNTGKLNLGDFNTGDSNKGIDNVGDFNIGSANSGSNNCGHSNSGDFNVGSYNTGSHNKGNANTGSFNVGSRNSGRWNKGSFHAGHFNTQNATVMMFNKPCPIPLSEIKFPLWLNKPNPREAFESATIEDLQKTLALPNFDFAIFEEITGISEADFKRRLS